MAKSGAQYQTFKSVTDRLTNKQTAKNLNPSPTIEQIQRNFNK